MIETKLFEIRDRMTFIPIVAVSCRRTTEVTEQEQYLFFRAGYCVNNTCILLLRASGGDVAYCDWTDWSGRTFPVAHEYITLKWDKLQSGDVIDVEFILGETSEKKQSERFEQI